MATVVEDLIKRLMDDQVVTKTEFSETIHRQTLDLFKKFDEDRQYREQLQEQNRREREQKQEQKYAELQTEFAAYRKETKTQTRWLIGIGVTLMLGVAAILLRLHT